MEYVLVGSMAMAAQGLIRATRDLDFFVSPQAENVARLKRALKALYEDDPNVDLISAEDLAGDYPAIERSSTRLLTVSTRSTFSRALARRSATRACSRRSSCWTGYACASPPLRCCTA